MTPADAVLTDALREAGHERVTPWHVRCVEAWAAQTEAVGLPSPSDFRVSRASWLEMRLKSDLYAGSLDALHVEAQWWEARLVAERSGRAGKSAPPAPPAP